MLELNFDFSKFITKEKPETDTVINKSTARRRKKGFGTVLGLGDPGRISMLPENVDEAFLEDYQDGLDRLLTLYVTSGALTITEATRYTEYIFGTIFGTHEHLGLFQYINNKGRELYSNDREVVSAAEEFLMRGWRIVKDGDRWVLLDDSLTTMMDMTGATDIAEVASTRVFSPDTAHIFLSDEVASRVAALAKRSGFDADSLVSMGQLDLLLSSTDSKEMAGYLLNYNALRFALKKSGKYQAPNSDVTFSTLYDDGYRLGSQIFYPTLSRTIMEKGTDSVVITPVRSDLHDELMLNVSSLAVVASDIREQVYRRNITPQKLTPITEFGQVIALVTEFWTTDAVRTSPTELYEILNRLDANYRSKELSGKYYRAVRQAFAEVLITEVYLLGNDRFSLSSFGFDTVGGKFFVYAGDRVFYDGGEDRSKVNLGSYPEEFFQQCMKSNFSPSFVEHNLEALLGYASDEFKKRLRAVNLDVGKYGMVVYDKLEPIIENKIGGIIDALS